MKIMILKINWFKVGYAFIILFLALLITQYAFQVNAGGHNWKTGDWLINYSGGFIRRGLIGTVSLSLADFFSVNVKWVVFGIQIFIFTLFAYFVLKEFFKFNKEKTSILWLLSPAFAFVFWLNDPAVAFRKEILIYLCLIFFLKAFKGTSISSIWYTLGLFTFAFTGLSHEAIVFFLPAFLFPIYDFYSKTNVTKTFALKLAIPIILLTGITLLIAKKFTGSEESMHLVCSALDPYHLKSDICDGAISWLKHDASFAHQEVVDFGPAVWLNYLFLGIISILPFLLLKMDKSLLCFYLFSIAGIAPLFYLASDHGRWISMIVTSSMLVTIWLRPSIIQNSLNKFGYAGFIYVSSWALPNCGHDRPGLGLLSQIITSFI